LFTNVLRKQKVRHLTLPHAMQAFRK